MSLKTEIYKYKVLNFLTRKFEVKRQEPPLDIKEAFYKFAEGDNPMSSDQLLRFMVEHQGENNCTLRDLEMVLQVGSSSTTTTSSNEDGYRGQGLSLNDFINFLLLDDFNGPLKDEV